jgi:hypothetical protein
VGVIEEEGRAMHHFDTDGKAVQAWFVGPWNSSIPVAVGYANEGVDEPHFHAEMFEVYLVAQGRSTALVDEKCVLPELGACWSSNWARCIPLSRARPIIVIFASTHRS